MSLLLLCSLWQQASTSCVFGVGQRAFGPSIYIFLLFNFLLWDLELYQDVYVSCISEAFANVLTSRSLSYVTAVG